MDNSHRIELDLTRHLDMFPIQDTSDRIPSLRRHRHIIHTQNRFPILILTRMRNILCNLLRRTNMFLLFRLGMLAVLFTQERVTQDGRALTASDLGLTGYDRVVADTGVFVYGVSVCLCECGANFMGEVVWWGRPEKRRLVNAQPISRDDILLIRIKQIRVDNIRVCARCKQSREKNRLTVAVFSIVLGKLWVRSHHGLTSIAPAGIGSLGSLNPLMGIGRFTSRMIWSRARTRLPPAESPLRIIWDGGTGLWRAPGGGLIRYRSIEDKNVRLSAKSIGRRVNIHIQAANASWMGHC